jgi:chromosome segregation ATPase
LSTTKGFLETERQKVAELTASNISLCSDMESFKIDMGTLEARLRQMREDKIATDDELISTKESLAEEKATIRQIKAEITSLQAQNEDLKSSVESALSREGLMTASKNELETLLQNTKELLEAERKKVKDVSDLKTSVESELKARQSELDELKSEMDSAFSRANFASKKKDELERVLASIEEERQNGHKRNQDLHSTNAVLLSELEHLRSNFEIASSQATEIKETYEELLAQAKAQLFSVNKELDAQKVRVEQHSEANSTLHAEYDAMKAEHEREYSKIAQKKQKLETKLQELKGKLRVERQKVDELKQQNGDLKADLNKVTSDLKVVTEKATVAEGDFDSQIASSKWELIAEQQKVAELASSNNLLESELTRLKDRLAKGENDVKQRCLALEGALATTEQQLSQAQDTIAELEQQIQLLTSRLEEGEMSQRELYAKYQDKCAELQEAKDDAAGTQKKIEDFLQATKEELLIEQKKVEDYSKLESTMQFEMESLKEEMHRTMATDREKALSSLREELNAEKEKVADLKRTKLSLQSKLRALLQANESSKAAAFVQEREIDMMFATKQEEIDAATQSNADLKSQMLELAVNHKESLAAVQKEFKRKVQDYNEMEDDFELTKKDLKELEEWNTELTEKNASLYAAVSQLKEEKESLEKSLDSKENALLELASVHEELVSQQKRAASLSNTKKSLESQLRVAKHAAESEKASAGVRVWETQMMLSNTKKELEESLNENAELASRVSFLESFLTEVEASHGEKIKEAEQQYMESKSSHAEALDAIKEKAKQIAVLEANIETLSKERESLLERTASLARGDEIQKVSLTTSQEEINKLQGSLRDLEERSQLLAEQLDDCQAKNSRLESEKENTYRKIENEQSEWDFERSHLHDRIDSLEREVQDSRDALESVEIECKKLQSREAESLSNLDSCRKELSNLETLKLRWNSDKKMLTQRIHNLTNDLEKGAESADEARRESMLSMQQSIEEQQLAWCDERESLKLHITNLGEEHKSAQEELKVCKETITCLEKQIGEMETTFQTKTACMKESLSHSRLVHKNSEQNVKTGLPDNTELQRQLDSQKTEVRDCHNQLSSERAKIQELLAMVTRKEKYIQSLMEQVEHQEERINDLQTEKDRLSEELASNLREAVKNSEDGRCLKKVESDLDEAELRETILESMLSDCKKELYACKQELELCKKEVFDEKYCNGVYKELISKLNQANDNLEQGNKRLVEENGHLKKSSATNASTDGIMVHDRSLRDNNMRNQIEKFTSDITSMDHQLQALVIERDTLKATAILLQEKVDTLQQSNDELKELVEKSERNQMEGAKDLNERLEAELSKSQKAIAEVSNKAKGMRHKMSMELEAAKAKDAALTKEVQTLKASNEEMEKRLEEQEKELDEFEQDFAMARDDARAVVEELRGQVQQLEVQNQQLMSDNTAKKVDELKNKLRQLISQNKRLQKEIEGFKTKERKLQRELGFGGWK